MDDHDVSKRGRKWIAPVLGLAGAGAMLVVAYRAGADGPAIAAAILAVACLAGLFAFHRYVRRDLTGRIAALEARNERLSRELEEQRVFIQAASHDLHEPLRKIQTFGERLRDRMGLLPDPTSLQYLDRMTDGAARMRILLDALLVHVRINDRNTRHTTVDLGHVVLDVLADLDETVRETGARIDVGELGVVEADEAQMRLLFANLLGNALKYRRPDANVAVRLSGRTEKGREGERIVIEISDNGIGFDPRHSERIFALFERLHSRADYEGIGIGLATCRKIVERHGGDISARGETGKGACFTLILPLQQANLPDNDPARANTMRLPS